ncbi:TIGR03086 family metal-binding protein [Nocardia anaemiae]|uniref:TIGR03086 family metal-binding protein n=1 Tax=Nocardia anaemiae TaxID=263910 RepID=UPI000AB44A32|nr:TIGR03086 family metal-binding protein [Nocardia anaemiae]
MHPNFDLEPAATALEAVVGAIADDQLTAPTPCADTSVRDLLAHVIGLTEAFRQAATKEAVGRSVPPAVGPETALPADWRSRIPAQLKALVEAWRDPAAWDGETEAGGVSAPAVVMATIALDEIVVHTWDLARAIGQQPESTRPTWPSCSNSSGTHRPRAPRACSVRSSESPKTPHSWTASSDSPAATPPGPADHFRPRPSLRAIRAIS